MIDVVNENGLIELAEETEVEVRGKKFEVAREVIPMEKLMDMSAMLSKSTIVPVMYQNRPENCFIALDMASRIGVSPMVVMQNLYIIQGKPSWAGQAISAMLNASPRFRNVMLHYVGEENTDSWGAYVTAIDVRSGEELKGGTVTIATSKKEGWFQKSGSKWQTMPQLMLAYRAYTWFGRVYAPELLMGLQSSDEIDDASPTQTTASNPYSR